MSRPAHLIRRAEARAWLAGSAVPRITFHRTTAEAVRAILEHGARVELGDPEATWGQGFYSSTTPDLGYGDTTLRVAVRITRPWIARDTMRAVEELEALMEETGISTRREALLAARYNGVVAYYRVGGIVVVALHDWQVKVIQGARHG